MTSARPLVLYHAHCANGFASAWVAHRAFGDAADYVAVQYGQEPPDVAGREVYILDFSYKRPVMSQIIGQAHKVCVLDHHKTAQEELTFPSCSAKEFKAPNGRIYICFDLNKSGARLAWEFFFTGKPSPWLVNYVEDRDLWRWELPYSREVSAYIRSYPFDFKLWDDWDNTPSISYYYSRIEGSAILRYQAQQVESICANAIEHEIDGHKVLVVNTSVLFSEVAGKLAENRPFGAAWFHRGDGKIRWSLRSRDGGVDVSEVARKRGGGGHHNAAGFETVGDIP